MKTKLLGLIWGLQNYSILAFFSKGRFFASTRKGGSTLKLGKIRVFQSLDFFYIWLESIGIKDRVLVYNNFKSARTWDNTEGEGGRGRRAGDEYRQVLFPQSTQSGNGHFLAYIILSIMEEELAQVGEGEGGGCTPSPLSLYLPSRTKLLCTLQLRGKIHIPYSYSTSICTLWLFTTKIFPFHSQGATRYRKILSSRFKGWPTR